MFYSNKKKKKKRKIEYIVFYKDRMVFCKMDRYCYDRLD